MRAESDPFGAILLLDAFDRFVFVMSILEEQSDEECAHLLRCSQRDVMIARLVALKHQSNVWMLWPGRYCIKLWDPVLSTAAVTFSN